MDVTYNVPLRRYMMTMRSRSLTGSGLDQFSLYEAPQPWGPWTQFFYTTNRDVDAGESVRIPSKWISSDGMEIYLVFPGYDSFRVRKGSLVVAGTRPPDPASTPSPPDEAWSVSRRSILTWASGTGATSHDIYFGTTHPPPFQRNQAESTFDTATTYPPRTTCCWRIDEVSDAGTTTGVVWRFTTRHGDHDGDGDVDQEDFGFFQKCLTGSGGMITPGCQGADFDSDGDVDPNDFGVFQPCMGGANRPPGC
jgi:hypothetical protein